MNSEELKALVDDLREYDKEREWFDFKHNYAEPEEIGEYISALSNSARLQDRKVGYLVWGINDETHEVVGTDFKPRREKKGNEELENWLAHNRDPRVSVEIHEVSFGSDHKRIVVFEIEAAQFKPTRFKGEAYIRVGTYKKKLKDHPDKERVLWGLLSESEDWSAQIVPQASVEDLDKDAIQFARTQYRRKFPHLVEKIDDWNDEKFLNKSKLCIENQITNTALILVGTPESAHHLSPAVTQITWILRGEGNEGQDYEHFYPPFITSVDKIRNKIRNLRLRYLPDGSLFPIEVNQYDNWVLREILHNCIAHQDYRQRSRISVIEKPDMLVFSNRGGFIPNSIEDTITRDIPPEYYRNQFLATAMVNLNMIDTIGSGIREVHRIQRDRFFPMPDYDISDPERVTVTLFGKVLDTEYTRVLVEHEQLDIMDVLALDKVQKGYQVSEAEADRLRSKKLAEGRRPNLHISSRVAATTGQEAEYIHQRGFQKQYYKDLILTLLCQFGPAKRAKVDEVVKDKLPDSLSDKQKKKKIANLLQEMRESDRTIDTDGVKRGAVWVLTESGRHACQEMDSS